MHSRVPTLTDLPRLGVNAINVWCGQWPHKCFHHGRIPLERIDLNQTILEVQRKLVCTECGTRGGNAMSAWPSHDKPRRA
jgi:hypothetical protein